MSQQESRVKKTFLNARVNLIFYFLTLALSFFSRKTFLDCLGADFVGLTGTLQNLLGFLNLAELGVGTAIGYVLYKPLFDHNQKQINGIISVMGYLYRWIGLIILGAGIILSIFLPFIFPDRDTTLDLPLIYFAYYSFLTSSLIGYFINYRQNLLGADQRNYVVTGYFQSTTIVKTIVQMTLAYYTQSYALWIAIELLFGIIYSFILNWKINQTYPWLRTEISKGRKLLKEYPQVIKYTKQIFIHKIGALFQYQVTPFMLYVYSSLATVALYQNYTLITIKVATAFSNAFGGIGASVGNLIAEGNNQKTFKIFLELFSLKFYIAGLICVPVYLLIDPFIILWLGEKYLLTKTTLIILLTSTFINSVRGVVEDFSCGFGLFWDVWSPIIESILILIIGNIGGIFWGLNGVLLGGLSGLIFVVSIWKPYMLFHWGFKLPISKYWIAYFFNTICIIIPLISTYIISNIIPFNPSTNFLNWISFSMIILTVYTIISYFTFLTFTTGMKSFHSRISLLFKKISTKI